MGKELPGNGELVLRFEPLIFQKCYCAICGQKLKRKITIFEKKYTYHPFGITSIKKRKSIKTVISPVYCCKNCDYIIERDNQKKIKLIQKEVGSFILCNGKDIVNNYKID